MGAIFLSASVPLAGRGAFHEDANPFLIQFAVRELVTLILGRRLLIWGGHPAITPMVSSVCEDVGVAYSNAVLLYQSRFFENLMPQENEQFSNLILTTAVPGDRPASLMLMRKAMMQHDFEAAVFVGGMEGVLDEFELFRQLHPNKAIIAVGAGGGAARQLARHLKQDEQRIDFASLFMDELKVSPMEPRSQVRSDEILGGLFQAGAE